MPKPYVYKRAEDLGIPVEDARSRILVTVTATDVVQAKKADSKHCAFARAALRLPDVNAAYFFRNRAFLEYADRMVRFLLPVSVQKEIVSFDRSKIIAPGVYQMSAMPPALSPKSVRKYNRKYQKQREIERAERKIAESKHEALGRTIEKLAASAPKQDTPEQRAFDNQLATLVNRHAGGRTVSGIQKATAPAPLMRTSPKRGYVHRTQYVRDLREPG